MKDLIGKRFFRSQAFAVFDDLHISFRTPYRLLFQSAWTPRRAQQTAKRVLQDAFYFCMDFAWKRSALNAQPEPVGYVPSAEEAISCSHPSKSSLTVCAMSGT